MVLRRAMTYGSVLASYNVEEFGTERVRRLTRDEIDERFSEFRRMTIFDEPPGLSLRAAFALQPWLGGDGASACSQPRSRSPAPAGGCAGRHDAALWTGCVHAPSLPDPARIDPE